ncbi:hypothetical protein R1flu_009745 [Riccia fluitans]|uniref:OVATE domain-containing protein n=1 Tax=Riccia fluitans TaxID=41844 RepID=A0ABD1Z343_9MARC
MESQKKIRSHHRTLSESDDHGWQGPGWPSLKDDPFYPLPDKTVKNNERRSYGRTPTRGETGKEGAGSSRHGVAGLARIYLTSIEPLYARRGRGRMLTLTGFKNVPAISEEKEAKFIAENSVANLIDRNLPEEDKARDCGSRSKISGSHHLAAKQRVVDIRNLRHPVSSLIFHLSRLGKQQGCFTHKHWGLFGRFLGLPPAPTMTTRAGCKGWMKARCGYSTCTKQIDFEQDGKKEKEKHSDTAGLNRMQSCRANSTDPASWERESAWSMLPEVEKEVVKKKLTLRKRRGEPKSSKLAPSSTLSLSDRIQITTSDGKCSLRDPYADVREAAKYSTPALMHFRASDVDGGAGSHLLRDADVNSGEELRIQAWKRAIFSCPSSDNELFTNSIDLDGQGKQGKKWTSNSSDDTECRQQRTIGTYSRSKSTWSRGSTLTVAEVEEQKEANGNGEMQKSRSKKGSRIIFLSTPPRLSLDADEDEQAATASILKCSSNGYGYYSKLDSLLKEAGSRLDKTLTTSHKANLPLSSVFEGVLDADAKGWSKLDLRKSKEGEGNETSIREVAVVPRAKESRHIDLHIQDQVCNLRLESDDASDSSHGKAHYLRGSRRHSRGEQLPSSKFLDQEKPFKKKRSKNTSSRRRKGRSKSKGPPPLLPNDLHGKVKESVAVVKSSYDPYTDFRSSMVEMIVEKEIQGAVDLEELLRCYLSLNSPEYHSVIVKVFADVWRELFSDNI